MKITIFANGVSNGGAEHVACNLANYFVAHGYAVDLLTMADDEPTYFIEKDVRRIILIEEKERRSFFYNTKLRLMRIYRYCKEADTNCYIAIMQAATLSLLSMKRILKAPVIITERSNPNRYAWNKKLLLKMFVSKADACVFQNKGQIEFYKKWMGKCKTVIIPNAVSVNINTVDWDKREKKIVAVGRLNKVKNYPMLIKAFSKIADIDKEYKLFIYGEGEERINLDSLIKKFGLDGRVQLCGFVRNIADYIKNAKIYVLTSDYEGMPNSLMEAMSLGLACISTDCESGSLRELISNQRGILVPTGNVDILADSLKRLIQNDSVAKVIAQNAVTVRNEFSENNIYKKWNEIVLSSIYGGKK
ncbi:MAG: glycosyltransferase family 4 protein [Hungatella sp.]|nr:glycosyltransferase family 4 protein [Hungatella sp.]